MPLLWQSYCFNIFANVDSNIMIKRHLISMIFFMAFVAAYGQTTVKQERDSLEQIWQNRVDSIATSKRIAFLKEFEHFPKDTSGIINIVGLHLHKLPNLSQFSSVSSIDASRNKLKKVRSKDINIDSLTRLNLENNNIKRICFPKNSAIESLNLSNNELRRIPFSMRKLKHLKSLTISNNHIKRIPRFLKRMEQLSSLEINFNKIKPTRADIRRLKNIEILLLAGNNIATIPTNINDLEKIKKLNFSKNKLNSVPPEFALLDSLEIIIFYKNEFTQIPLEITMLPNLRIIDFYYNDISEIPDKIGNIRNLSIIFLAYNKIEVMPDTMRSLHKLKALYIHDNQLRNVPSWITELSNLEIIDISYNNLFSIPDMSKMPALVEVDIQENEIEYFPWKLMEKPELKLLFIRGNPFILDKEEKQQLKITLEEKRAVGVVIVD